MDPGFRRDDDDVWIPAFAGMTVTGGSRPPPGRRACGLRPI